MNYIRCRTSTLMCSHYASYALSYCAQSFLCQGYTYVNFSLQHLFWNPQSREKLFVRKSTSDLSAKHIWSLDIDTSHNTFWRSGGSYVRESICYLFMLNKLGFGRSIKGAYGKGNLSSYIFSNKIRYSWKKHRPEIFTAVGKVKR